MDHFYRPGSSSEPWGPFISPNFHDPRTTNSDVIISSVPFALTLLNFIIAIWQAYGQTKGAREPFRSSYVWMIWTSMTACFLLSLLAYLHVLRHIPSSFALYFGDLVSWAIQVMCVFQIIINRIRVIDINQKRSRQIFIGVTTYISMVIITAFVLWLPGQLAINATWGRIGIIWDRTEKSIFLLLDLALNWYFLRTVKHNLISNGITKYKKLVRFNEKIIALSLFMDAMLIAATAIPKTWVYILFHPLCYLVKLNIEMAMANLIKRIAISKSHLPGQAGAANEFKSTDTTSVVDTSKKGSVELGSLAYHNEVKSGKAKDRVVSFPPRQNQIRSTTEYTVTSEPNPFEIRGSESHVTDEQSDKTKLSGRGIIVEAAEKRSLDSSAEAAESFQDSVRTKRVEDSDDEVVLVEKRGRR